MSSNNQVATHLVVLRRAACGNTHMEMGDEKTVRFILSRWNPGVE